MSGYEGSRQQFLNDANDEIDKLLYNFELAEDVRVYRIDLDAVCVYDMLWRCTSDTKCINNLKIMVHYRICKPRPTCIDNKAHGMLEYAIVDVLNKLESDTGAMVHSVEVPYNSSFLRVDVKLWQDNYLERGR